VVLRNFLSPAELAEAKREAVAAMAADVARRNDEKPLGIAKGLDRHSTYYHHHLHHGRHVPLVRGLVGDEVEPATGAFWDKPRENQLAIGPHRDGAFGEKNGAVIWM
jgi:hypothetical protein